MGMGGVGSWGREYYGFLEGGGYSPHLFRSFSSLWFTFYLGWVGIKSSGWRFFVGLGLYILMGFVFLWVS